MERGDGPGDAEEKIEECHDRHCCPRRFPLLATVLYEFRCAEQERDLKNDAKELKTGRNLHIYFRPFHAEYVRGSVPAGLKRDLVDDDEEVGVNCGHRRDYLPFCAE